MNLNAAQVQSYRAQGYLVVPEIFAPDQAETMIGHYMKLRTQGPHPGDSGGTDDQPDDPNHTYPRMINMHAWDPASATWATRPDLLAAVEQLIDDEPVLRQTMLYFKPPGGRGQGLHQDEQYITINPLIGLWIALDPSDDAVGQMVVVPGSHGQLRPVEKADTRISFTRAQSQLPPEPQSSASTWLQATASSSTAKPSTAPIPTRPPTAGGAASSATTSANAPSTSSRPKVFT